MAVDLRIAMAVVALVVVVLAVVARRRPADPVSGPLRGRGVVLVAVAHLAPLLTLPVLVPLVLAILVRRNVEVRARVARAFDLQLVATLLTYGALEVVLSTRTVTVDDLVWIDGMLAAISFAVLAAGVASIVSAWRGSRVLATRRPLLSVVLARDAAPGDVPEPTSPPR